MSGATNWVALRRHLWNLPQLMFKGRISIVWRTFVIDLCYLFSPAILEGAWWNSYVLHPIILNRGLQCTEGVSPTFLTKWEMSWTVASPLFRYRVIFWDFCVVPVRTLIQLQAPVSWSTHLGPELQLKCRPARGGAEVLPGSPGGESWSAATSSGWRFQGWKFSYLSMFRLYNFLTWLIWYLLMAQVQMNDLISFVRIILIGCLSFS